MPNNKKKILYLITQSEQGGAQRYILDLAKNLEDGLEVIVAFGEPGETGWLPQALKPTTAIYYHIPHLYRAINPINDFLALIEIIKLIKRLKPDVIHLNSSKISILGSLVKIYSKFKIRNSKFIYTVHGWVFNEPLLPWKKIFYKYAEKYTAWLKDKIICISQFDLVVAKKELKIPENKLVLIHNGREPLPFLARDEAREKLFRKSGIVNRGSFIIGSIGNLYKTKGYEYLIKAAKIIKGSIPDPRFTISDLRSPIHDLRSPIHDLRSPIHDSRSPIPDSRFTISDPRFTIPDSRSPIPDSRSPIPDSRFTIYVIGDGPERSNLETLIKQNQLENIVYLAGRIDNASQLLKAFDVYVCPSVKEGLSYTLIEAMQAGLPIVATDVGGNPDLITDGKDGLLVPPSSPHKLAEAMISLVKNKNQAYEYGQTARNKALQNFTLKQMVTKTKSLYE